LKKFKIEVILDGTGMGRYKIEPKGEAMGLEPKLANFIRALQNFYVVSNGQISVTIEIDGDSSGNLFRWD
jgi:hypothetical protein